mgnify:FL=1
MRRSRLILLCLGMAFLVSCSKDDTDNVTVPIDPSENSTTPYGTFEGEWQLSKYGKTCPGTIEVDSDKIVFDLPADYLLPRLGLIANT